MNANGNLRRDRRADRRCLLTAAVLAVIAAGGCASKSKRVAAEAETLPEQQTLSQITPPVSLPPPATQRAAVTPFPAMEAYAKGRLALLANRKQAAVEQLTRAVELDPYSSVAFRDLGYAWLGTDNDRSLAAYRRAVEIDPNDVDSRVQIARLLMSKQKNDEAIEQLRVARLADDYREHGPDAAIVDMLLGRLLSERGYYRGAIECFESVLPIVEAGAFELRGRPELNEVVAKPAILKLRIADLSSQIGDYDRAIALYNQIRADEPIAAAGVELRIIQTLAKRGDIRQASVQMLELVDFYDASRASMQAYIDLFEGRGGDKAAIKAIDAAPPTEDKTARAVLKARLLRRADNASGAITLLTGDAVTPSTQAVRELVMAMRDAGRADDVPLQLLRWMNSHPESMPSISRGWAMISHGMQPSPLTVHALQAINVPTDLAAAQQFTLAKLAADQGQPALAKASVAKASRIDASRVRRWATARANEIPPDVDYGSQEDVERFVEEFSNDASYLSAAIGLLVKNGHNAYLQTALQAVVERTPANLPAVASLVVLLEAADRRPEAIRLVERSIEATRSAPEWYQLASLLSQLGESTAYEQLLRRAQRVDGNYAPVCNDLGYLLADSGRELDFAEGLLYRAVGLEPENPAYIDSLGWLLYKRGKFEEARKYLEQALAASDPADPVVLDHAADAAYRTGDLKAAAAHWQAAINHIRQHGASEPQLRLRIEQKLRQLQANQPVDVAPTTP